MSTYDERREDVTSFAEALRETIEQNPSIVGAFVVLVHNNGRSTGIRSPLLNQDPLTVAAEIGRWRDSYRTAAGLLERDIRARVVAIAKMEDGVIEGRA